MPGTTVSTLVHDVVTRNNVVEMGNPNGRPLVFAHGFGCDQGMWRLVAPHFTDHRVVLFDHVGAGGSDAGAYDRARYDSLDGYADDVAEICEALDLRDAVLVGHSVSSMISVIAASTAEDRVSGLVLIGPSPRYVDEGDYVGGFSRDDIDHMLLAASGNFTGWAQAMGPTIMGNDDRPELGEELTAAFCRLDPRIASHFAEVTFLSDNRRDLATVSVPTLVLQCSDDPIAPPAVGAYVHRMIPGSRLEVLDVTGHCPHLSHPRETIAVIERFLAEG
jgi:sigma-B regulation protein RsbQ